MPGDTTEAITRLALAVFRLNGELLHWGDRQVKPLGLTSSRWQMLGAIALSNAPVTAPQIAEAMGVTRQGAQKQLNLLLEQKLVVTRPNPANKRSPFYVLTSQGSERYLAAMELWMAHVARLATQMPARQAATAVQALESLQRSLHSGQAAEQDSSGSPSSPPR